MESEASESPKCLVLYGDGVHSNAELGEIALSHLVKLEPRNAANYIVLCDIRAHSSRWGDSGKTRSMMSDTGLKRTPGCSWVEVEIRVQPSRVGDYNYPSPT
ncbi:hypothetical protein TB1_001290 [Malus domestica]